MSVTNETSVAKKRGRPKKEIKKIDFSKVSEPETLVSKDETQALARKAVDEILSQAAEKAQNITENPVDISGAKTGASSHDNLAHGQEDYLPGTRVLDIQMVPRRVYDEDLKRTRELGRPEDYHYCWVHTDKVTVFRINGYKFCSYNGGAQSGLADGGFSGTGIYERTFDNHVRNGDMFLMWCSLRQYEDALKHEAEQAARWESAAEEEIHNDGYRRGIRTFKEVNGVTLYN